jgi:hypothetical protein
MGPISMLFGNPAVKVLEERLWEAARKRYLQEHPSERNSDSKTIMRKTRTAYKDSVAASLKEADRKVKAKWGQFKHGMTVELKRALATVLRMSDVDWYSVEVGQIPSPNAIAVPYQLLKHMTGALLFQFLRKEIDFENLDDETLEALATYAADERFQEVLEDARHHHEPFAIGGRAARFVVAEIIKGDSYFLDVETHHSRIDMVILSNLGAGSADGDKHSGKAAAKRWFDQDRKNRRNDRRFTGDGWEIGYEELKTWTVEA